LAGLIKSGLKTAIIMRRHSLQQRVLTAAGRIAARTGARLMCDTFTPRIQRGAGQVPVERLPYFSEQVKDFIAGTELIVFVGAKPPVSFFAYPDKESWLTPEGCQLAVLAHAQEDGVAALEALAEACGADGVEAPVSALTPEYSLAGEMSAEFIMSSVARHLPEIADESASSGFPFYGLTAASAALDYLNLTGGAIGSMDAEASSSD
jgi:acetolactate synthase-1/2/3 large subunit